MSDFDVVRAWKDPKYRRSLTDAQRASMPEHPAGPVELTDDELKVAGGLAIGGGGPITTAPTCTMFTFLNWNACGCFVPMTTAITCTQYTFNHWRACCH